MKKVGFLMIFTLAAGACSGCNFFKYINKKVNIYREKDVVDKKIQLRYYFDQIHVPYIDVSEYYKEFFSTDLSKNKDENGYQYYLSEDSYVYFNLKDNDISISGLTSFSNHPDFISTNGKSFLQLETLDESEHYVKTIDLDKYSINIYEEDDKVYAPVTFLSKICGGVNLYNVAYNGKDLYVLDYGASLTGEERTADYYGEKYSKKFSNIFFRSKDMARYSYNELCFVFDNFTGETTQMLFGDDKFKSLGLDGYLTTYYPEIKEYLLATGRRKYGAGVMSLFFGLDDGGHTGLLSYYPFLLVSLFTKVTGNEKLSELYHAVVDRENEAEKVYQSCDYYRSASLGTPGGFYYYLEQESQTAYIGFDSFDVDYVGWDNFYNGVGEVPVETDTYAFVRDKLYKAKLGGAKNIILDVTTNGGGDTTAFCGLIGLFNKAKADFTMKDTFNEYTSTEKYLVDINLDGEFNEQDIEECNNFNFNVGVLTSRYSFSCANLFPSAMKELGYMIIGQKSGGGSCAISIETTAEGIAYVRSSHLTLYNKNGENLDNGVLVDYEIDLPVSEYVDFYDASNFFNCSLMNEILTNHYSHL